MGDLLPFPQSRRRKIANLESEYNTWMALRARWPGGINDLIEALNAEYWLDGHDINKIEKEKQE